MGVAGQGGGGTDGPAIGASGSTAGVMGTVSAPSREGCRRRGGGVGGAPRSAARRDGQRGPSAGQLGAARAGAGPQGCKIQGGEAAAGRTARCWSADQRPGTGCAPAPRRSAVSEDIAGARQEEEAGCKNVAAKDHNADQRAPKAAAVHDCSSSGTERARARARRWANWAASGCQRADTRVVSSERRPTPPGKSTDGRGLTEGPVLP